MTTLSHNIFIPVDWNKSLECGIKEVDNQQKEYVVMTNNFIHAYNNSNHENHMENTIKYLTEYCHKLFLTQEAYMTLYSYPPIEDHLKVHTDFLRKTNIIFKNFITFKNEQSTRGLHDTATELCFHIINWFEFHISQNDKRVAEYIKLEAKTKGQLKGFTI